MESTRRLIPVLLMILAVVASACGGGGDSVEVAASPAAPPAAPAASDVASPAGDASDDPSDEGNGGGAGAVTSVDDLQSAVIQIVAEGSFRDPEVGTVLNAAGAGSGFFVDPSGIAVTNNHVVTGSALLEVYVDGEDDPLNAQVLGVSECNDLAVIQVDVDDDVPYLEWYTDEINTGLDIFVGGFPLGDPEFTLTSGIVSKASAAGDTNWASNDAIIEHDASTNPGNSGGPVVTEEAQVVGIHYAGDPEARQQFAISAEDAEGIVEQLADGEDVESIGVNGEAVSDGEGSSGIWVSGVASGTPADEAGIAAGDIITKMEGLVIATDGTMSEYCDVLRSRNPDDQLALEVLRFDTEVVLEGELNGDPLVETFSFAQELEDEATTTAPATETYDEFMTIMDDTGAISVDVPAEWADVNGVPYTDAQGNQIVDVRASSDLTAFGGGWDTPGMIFSASSALARSASEVTLLDDLVEPLSGQCTYDGRQPYSDPAYSGQYDTYTNCGGVGASYVVVGAVPPGREYVIRVQIQINGDRDLDALDTILGSFVVIGQV